jgi:Flp pilus assembly protein TadG
MRSVRDQRGQSLLEFALIAPFVLFLLLALVDFGIAIDRRIVLDHAVREGARYASVGGQALSGTPAAKADVVSYTNAQGQAIPTSVDVCYRNDNGNSLHGDMGDEIQVTANYQYHFVTGFWAAVGLPAMPPIVMNASATARVESPLTDAASLVLCAP